MFLKSENKKIGIKVDKTIIAAGIKKLYGTPYAYNNA